MKYLKNVAIICTAVLLAAVAAFPTAAAKNTVKVYDKDVFLNDEGAGAGWLTIPDDPGFYFDAAGDAVHKSPTLYTETAKKDSAYRFQADTADHTEGASSLSVTYSTGFFFYWMSEKSGKTLDLSNTQYMLMDLYVEDTEIFLNASDCRVSFTNSTDKNNLKWDGYTLAVTKDTLKGTYLRKGWNSVKLYLAGTDEDGNTNLKAITGIRFFAVDLTNGTKTIKVDNVHFVSKGYTTQEAGATTTTLKTTASKTTAASGTAKTTGAADAKSTDAAATGTTSATVSASASADASDATEETSATEATSATAAEDDSGEDTDVTTTTGSSSDAQIGTDDETGTPIGLWIGLGAAAVIVAAIVVVLLLKKHR